GRGEGTLQALSPHCFQGEQAIRGPQGEDVVPVHHDVTDLSCVLRYYIGDIPAKQRLGRAATELIVRGRSDPRSVPVDRPVPGGPGAKFLEAGIALPQESERIAGARGPFTEEDVGGLKRL